MINQVEMTRNLFIHLVCVGKGGLRRGPHRIRCVSYLVKAAVDLVCMVELIMVSYSVCVTVKMFLSESQLPSPSVLCLSPAATNFTIPDGVSHTDPADCACSLLCWTKIGEKETKIYPETKEIKM